PLTSSRSDSTSESPRPRPPLSPSDTIWLPVELPLGAPRPASTSPRALASENAALPPTPKFHASFSLVRTAPGAGRHEKPPIAVQNCTGRLALSSRPAAVVYCTRPLPTTSGYRSPLRSRKSSSPVLVPSSGPTPEIDPETGPTPAWTAV